ncbi:fused MFS/spermidine synthase [Kitasatospora purpeofusca]|uniref:spermidine synthase n=1 Tax=Kitasatospora purpeofusca TaxID=67352 RepID=UPI002A5A1CED|nr:fused MFS/spermidine synthase [Kitasatospora purpeofusca]MDY0814617.1 fused MFS/spermidine synthase [Kitasatospora purpeofusca]
MPDPTAPPQDSPADERLPVLRQTDLGRAKLLPDVDHDGGWLLTLDDTPQSYVDLGDPTHLEFEYTRRLGHLVDALGGPEDEQGRQEGEQGGPGRPVDALHLGGGALTLPRYLAATRPGSRQRVVEVDGPLLDLVEQHLPWQGPGVDITAEVGDAREALATLARTAPGSLDLVVADVFHGSRTPGHLTSVEFLRLAAAVLRPGGLYAANLADGAPLAFARAQTATLRAVFPQTCLIAEPPVLRGRRYGNILLVGSAGPLPVADLVRRLAGDIFPARLTDGADLAAFAGRTVPVTDATATDSPPPPDGAFSVG